jgi:hypothetical protein
LQSFEKDKITCEENWRQTKFERFLGSHDRWMSKRRHGDGSRTQKLPAIKCNIGLT